jgi:hypothetical protein
VQKNGRMSCMGLNPSGSLFRSPGINNDADTYHAENCSEVSSDFCMAKCVKNRFPPKTPLPVYGYGPQGTDCHEWAGDVLHECQKICKTAAGL